MLDFEKIEVLFEQVCEKIREKMFLLNRDEDTNALNEFLRNIGMQDLISTTPIYETYKSGKIVILGQSSVNKDVICGIAKSLGIDKDRLELHLSYNDAISYNFKKLKYNPTYRVVLVGPIPHSTTGKLSHSSAITEMEQEEGYPKIARLIAGQELKITKTNIKQTLQMLLEENYI